MDWNIEFKIPNTKQPIIAPFRKTLVSRSFKIWNSLGQTTMVPPNIIEE